LEAAVTVAEGGDAAAYIAAGGAGAAGLAVTVAKVV
jgi:hypothetical protein